MLQKTTRVIDKASVGKARAVQQRTHSVGFVVGRESMESGKRLVRCLSSTAYSSYVQESLTGKSGFRRVCSTRELLFFFSFSKGELVPGRRRSERLSLFLLRCFDGERERMLAEPVESRKSLRVV